MTDRRRGIGIPERRGRAMSHRTQGKLRAGHGERGTRRWTSSTTDTTLWLSGDFDVRSTMEVRSAIYEHLDGYEQRPHRRPDRRPTPSTSPPPGCSPTPRIEASRAGHHLRVRGCGPAVRRMLQLSRLARFIEVERAAATA